MADPFAPPTDPTATSMTRASRMETMAPAPAPMYDARDRPDRGLRDHPEPAKPGLFWVIAAIGVGLLLLARLILYFTVVDDLPEGAEAPALFAVLGLIALSLGLCLAAVLQRGLATPWRIALLLGAGFFAIAGDGIGLTPGSFL